MKKHLIAIGMMLMLLVVGLSGCTEQTATQKETDESGLKQTLYDDDEFLRVSEAIVEDLHPLSVFNLEESSGRTSNYKIQIAKYELSEECEFIRELLDVTLGDIKTGYELYCLNGDTSIMEFDNSMLIEIKNHIDDLKNE